MGVTEAPVESVPLPVEEPDTLRVTFRIQTKSGTLSIEVFDSRKCMFPDDEVANFDSFADVSDDEVGVVPCLI